MNKLESPSIRRMFETIAPDYDFLNRLLSLRQDVYWRKAMVRAMSIPKSAVVLDAACGTGDVTLEIIRQKGNGVRTAGIDFSKNMLDLGLEKIRSAGKEDSISFSAADALHPPFRPDTFDAVTIAFGIRNIQDKREVLERFYEVLKPGGQMLVLELTTPENPLFLSAYLLYFQKILPLIGKLVSGDEAAYQYLPDSVLKFPNPAAFAKIMTSAGFTGVRWRYLTLGITTLFSGRKPVHKPGQSN